MWPPLRSVACSMAARCHDSPGPSGQQPRGCACYDRAMPSEPTRHSVFLRELAARGADPYLRLGAGAGIVAGSVAEGISDEWSDIDMILFYRALPAEDDLT